MLYAPARVTAAWPMTRSAISARKRRMWFQMTSTPDCGIGNGTPPIAPVTPLPPSESFAEVAFALVAS